MKDRQIKISEEVEDTEEILKIKEILFLTSEENTDEFTPEELERLAEASKQGTKAGAELRRKFMKDRQIKISEEAKERLQKAAYALRLSFSVLEKTYSAASIAFKQAGPTMEKALKKCKPG